MPFKKKIPRSLGILCTYWTMEWEHPYHARGSRWVVAEKFQFPTVLPRQPTPKASTKSRPWGLHPLILWIQKLCLCRSFWPKRPTKGSFGVGFLAGKEFKFNSEIRGYQICERKLSYVVEPAFWDGYVERATF